MKKKNIIKKNNEIIKVINNKKNKKVSPYFIIYYNKNNFDFNRFCISVSKKIGKANVRNLYKRRIKNILTKNLIEKNNDYVIILRKEILNLKYLEIERELIKLIKEIIK